MVCVRMSSEVPANTEWSTSWRDAVSCIVRSGLFQEGDRFRELLERVKRNLVEGGWWRVRDETIEIKDTSGSVVVVYRW